jgi:hypothetical protein
LIIKNLEDEKMVQNVRIQRRNPVVFALSGILLIFFIAGFALYHNFKLSWEISRQNSQIQVQRIHEPEQERQFISEEGRLSVAVQDNGKGIDLKTREQSSGKVLANIRSKVASFGGHFDLSSEDGKGTESIVEFKT